MGKQDGKDSIKDHNKAKGKENIPNMTICNKQTQRPGQPTLLFLWRKQQSSETCRFNERFQCFSCNKDGHKIYFLFQKQIGRPIGQEIQAKQSCVPKCKLVLKCKGLKGPIPPLKSEIRPGTKE